MMINRRAAGGRERGKMLSYEECHDLAGTRPGQPCEVSQFLSFWQCDSKFLNAFPRNNLVLLKLAVTS